MIMYRALFGHKPPLGCIVTHDTDTDNNSTTIAIPGWGVRGQTRRFSRFSCSDTALGAEISW